MKFALTPAGLKMQTEQQLRDQANQTQLKLEALDWLAANGGDTEHKDSCAYLDDTGHPAPCTCGLFKRTCVQTFLRKLVLAS